MPRSFLKIRYMLAFDARLNFVPSLLVLTLALFRLLLKIRIALVLYAHHQLGVVPLDREPSRDSYIHLFRESEGEGDDDSKQANRRWMLRAWVNRHYDNVDNFHVAVIFAPEAKFIAVWNNAILFPVLFGLSSRSRWR